MAALLAASQWRRKLRQQQMGTALQVEGVEKSAAAVVRIDTRRPGDTHALDRVAMAA
jgi:protein ImuA